ncbi:nucleoside hydrolase [Escherichia coli]
MVLPDAATVRRSQFNIAADPEAAACVFRSGIEIVMCGLDVTNQAILTLDYLATLPELNRTGKMLHALFSHYRSGSMQSGLRMHSISAPSPGWCARTYSPSSRVLSR